MTITALPTPPSRNSPGDFAARGDAFLGALPTFATEANALAADVNSKQSTASAAANTATTKASEASTSASQADTSKVQAEAARDSAIAAKNEAELITEKFQGSLSSDPSLDKSGLALSAGDWYINSSTGYIRVYNGSTWVQGISSVAGVSSVNGLTGAISQVVTLNATETLTNKTFTGYTETVYNLAGTEINSSNGSIQTKTLSANTTFTETLSSGQSVILGITAGSYSVTWPAGVKWSKIGGSGTAPSLTSTGVNWVVLWRVESSLQAAFLGAT